MVRKAVDKDIESVTILCIQTAPFEGTDEAGEEEFYNDLFTETLTNPERLLLVAHESSVISGFAYAEIQHEPDDCTPEPHVSLDMIGVHPDHRHKGFARALMDEVHAWTRSKGISHIQLAVGESHIPAIKLYESLGYKTVMRKMQFELD